MTATPATERTFSFITAVSALEYAEAVIEGRHADFDRLGVSHRYEDKVLERLQGLKDYLKTEYEHRLGAPFPETKKGLS